MVYYIYTHMSMTHNIIVYSMEPEVAYYNSDEDEEYVGSSSSDDESSEQSEEDDSDLEEFKESTDDTTGIDAQFIALLSDIRGRGKAQMDDVPYGEKRSREDIDKALAALSDEYPGIRIPEDSEYDLNILFVRNITDSAVYHPEQSHFKVCFLYNVIYCCF